MNRRDDARLRLLSAKERNDLDAERRAGMAPRFQALANRGAPVVITSHNLFPTPVDVVQRLLALADVRPGMRVLEPSAGTGRILSALPAGCDVVAVELSPDLQRYLYGAFPGVALKGGDFLTRADLGDFDRVVMNPPFQRGEDVRHILHARSMLKPGGRLVSLCYDGVKQNRDLRPLATTWEVLPAGSFKSEGTNAGVVLLTIEAAGAVVSG